MDIIDCAIKMEEESRVHYQKLAQATSVDELKRLFTLLAASEEEHHASLMKLKKGLPPGNEKYSRFSEGVCVFRPLIDATNLEKELEKDSNAYRHVMAEEEESIKLYEQLAAEVKDPKMREVINKLADEERRHLKVVMNIYSFVEDPRTYLEWVEFSNLKTL